MPTRVLVEKILRTAVGVMVAATLMQIFGVRSFGGWLSTAAWFGFFCLLGWGAAALFGIIDDKQDPKD